MQLYPNENIVEAPIKDSLLWNSFFKSVNKAVAILDSDLQFKKTNDQFLELFQFNNSLPINFSKLTLL